MKRIKFTPLQMIALLALLFIAIGAIYFSISGMILFFPRDPKLALALGIGIEAAKLIAAAWLLRQWTELVWLWRLFLVAYVVGTSWISAAGVYAIHVGYHGVADLFGLPAGGEEVVRGIITVMVAYGDLLALVLAADLVRAGRRAA
jgi:hypothetical protein